MQNEVWKEIKGYEGLYSVSSLGNVKSIKRDIILKSCIANCYQHINLCKNGKSTTFNIHRLVAITFLDLLDKSHVVDHIDDNKLNNCIENLRFVSQRENVRKGFARKWGNDSAFGVKKHNNGKWRAICRYGKKIKHIGMFKTK